MKKYHLGFTDEMTILLKSCVNKRFESISGHFFRQNDTICRRMLKRDSKLLSYQLQMSSSDAEVREDIYDSSFPMTSRTFGKNIKSVQIITDIFRFKELNREISMDVA